MNDEIAYASTMESFFQEMRAMSEKKVYLPPPSEFRLPEADIDFRPNRLQVESARRRAMDREIPQSRSARQQRFLLVAVVCFVVVVYGAFLVWEVWG